jgi:hypothetical protein
MTATAEIGFAVIGGGLVGMAVAWGLSPGSASRRCFNIPPAMRS